MRVLGRQVVLGPAVRGKARRLAAVAGCGPGDEAGLPNTRRDRHRGAACPAARRAAWCRCRPRPGLGCDHRPVTDAEEKGDVTVAWDRNAEEWLAWTRTPDHDVYYWRLNFPAFVELVPPPGRLTLDVGCGEGRLGRWLAEQGHHVWGIDSSPTLVEHAQQAGGYEQIVCGDAAAMPLPDACSDLAIAFMSLHDMPDPGAVIGEITRVLEPAGVLCAAIIHPLNRSPEALEDYFTERRFRESITRRGLTMTFEGVDRPLELYTRALATSGFVIEELREPRADPATVANAPELAPAARKPYFLILRCRRSHS